MGDGEVCEAGDPCLDRTDLLAERARDLAFGLRHFRPARPLPEALWESAYLLVESQKFQRSLLEQLRILGLLATSLDQFFITELPRWQKLALHHADYAEQLALLPNLVMPMLDEAGAWIRKRLLPEVARVYHVHLNSPQQLPRPLLGRLRLFFQERVYPLLTPLAVDPGHPFPFISSHSLNVMVVFNHGMRQGRPPTLARIKVPRLLPRYIGISEEGADSGSEDSQVRHRYVQSEEVVRFFLPELFHGLHVEEAYLFRLVRAAEGHSDSTLPVEIGARQRQLNLPVVRLDVEKSMPEPLLAWLVDHLQAPSYTCYPMFEHTEQLQLVELANLISRHGE